MTINLTLRSFDRGIDDVRKGADRLSDDTSRIDTRVRGFLDSGWTGVAAESFVEAWEEWKTAAGDVHEALTSMGELLVVTRDDFIQQDDASQQRSDEVAARIVDRLG
ncbi:WXG100 family type VII secretion target [Nocardioides sp. BE266]|uniref:WXG100 family type VII secretion target n=1 Tax=Nocardioides sp. BE266 TaxID=2817725 RepID=UPI002856D6B0|nr:WXG100 family type VII secretion target [Nocardioides sp. BE266]MDR7253458.1 WXG100 family type VII secretion target [Nocardioides sp. BE266]